VLLSELDKFVTAGKDEFESYSYWQSDSSELLHVAYSYVWYDLAPITVPLVITPGIVKHSTTPYDRTLKVWQILLFVDVSISVPL